ncbi:HNH endonuclease [Arthrobacter sp. CAN_C5]|uniref:HNH endonuclease n=1 Tax=Arthrobacter sp. CAN_C5 TaxID=2760706 RepID=UPI00247A7AA4|nr:HNH endonuclease [Arthrobacter sp. CAN_C5]
MQDEEPPAFTEERLDNSWSIGSTGRTHPEDQDFGIEGGFQRVLSNRFERSRLNRRVAIELHGRECCVCGSSFESTYGSLSGGYIEIHHLIPVSMMKNPAKLDPREDLVPLCANCHRMAHREWPPVTPDELRQAISTRGV